MRNLIAAAAALTASLYFATPIPASAGSANQGPGWGTVVGAGILGGIIGGATAPAPQQQIIVVVPQVAAPAQTPPPTYNPALSSGGALALGSGNPINDSLLATSRDRQQTALANSMGNGCIGISAFPMGVTRILGPAKGLAYWSIRCKDGRSFVVQIALDGKAMFADCRLLQDTATPCFRKF